MLTLHKLTQLIEYILFEIGGLLVYSASRSVQGALWPTYQRSDIKSLFL